MCNIHQQMSLCRFHGDSSECEMQAPPGLGVEGPPCNPAEWIGRIVARNCAFTSFSNGLWLSVRPTFTNEHLFLFIPPLQHVLCIQNSRSGVLHHSCDFSIMSLLKKLFLYFHFNLCFRKIKKVTLIFAEGKNRLQLPLSRPYLKRQIIDILTSAKYYLPS